MNEPTGNLFTIESISLSHASVGIDAIIPQGEARVLRCNGAREDAEDEIDRDERFFNLDALLRTILKKFERGQPCQFFEAAPDFPVPALFVRLPVFIGPDLVEAMLLPIERGWVNACVYRRKPYTYPRALQSKLLDRTFCWYENFPTVGPTRGQAFG